MTALACKHCGATISAENITDGELAICEHCTALNNLSDKPLQFPQKDKAKHKGRIPNKITYRQLADEIEIRYRWFSSNAWEQIGHSVFWSFLTTFLAIILLTNTLNLGWFGLCYSPALLFVFLLAITSIYQALCEFLNHTTLTISKQGIEMKSRPFPTFKHQDQTIPQYKIRQVYCKHTHAGYLPENKRESYIVYYNVTNTMTEVPLVRDVPTIEAALFIEQEIERFYNITDVPIAGEWGKDYEKLKNAEQFDVSQQNYQQSK